MGKIFSSIITYVILINLCYGQPTQEWVRLYPDTNIFTADAYALALDDSGNIYITGSADSSNKISYCTVKYSESGILLWATKFYGSGMGGRFAYAIALDKLSNVYITGYSYEPGRLFDFCTIKYNSNGVQQWVKYFNGPVNGQDEAKKVAIDNSGNIYVSGFTTQSGGGQAFTTVKYSADGIELWNRTYPLTTSAIYTVDMKIDDSCYVYVTGDFGIGITVKYDSSGNQIWSAIYPKVETGITSLALDKHKNVYITGYFINTSIGGTSYITIKYSSSGIQQWLKMWRIDSTVQSTSKANSIAVDNNENIYVSGFSLANIYSTKKLTTLKYSETGELQWAIKDTACIGAMSTYMDIDKNNNIYVVGEVCLPPPYIKGMLTIKYNSSGIEQWRTIYQIVSIAHPNFVKVDDQLNLFLVGQAYGKMCTIKYSQLVGIVNNDNRIPNQFKLYQNYPNPFNPKTKIKFDISSNIKSTPGGQMANVKIVIYNILGEEIAIIVNKPLKPGSYEVEWNAADYPSGIYFYRLFTNDYTESRKMILIK